PYDNYAIEVVTYLQLNRGFYRMGVNSDDGFVVRVAPGQPGVRGMILGQYDGGRGAADSLFDVVIEENGYYPFRLLYWQGTGGASCEWFSVNPDTGDKTLINGTGTSIKAYKTASDRAVVTKLLPADGFQGAEPAAGVRLTIEDGTTQLKTGSVRLMIDDVAVTPSVTKSGTTTTISWAPPLQYEFLSDHTGRLVWTETTNPETEWTEDFTFRVRDVDGTKDPAVLLSLPADEMLADGVVLVWSIGKYATQLNPASLQIQVDGNNVTAQAAVTEDATRHYVTVDLSGTTFNAG
ncbi:MAG: hypothetical protein KDM81_21640, partial [Verrucomicrobiae bacterium]|nr:hypothetical protein [Verrucomicrobiae bacterium]